MIIGAIVKRVATISPAHRMACGGDGEGGIFDIESPRYSSGLLEKKLFGETQHFCLVLLRDCLEYKITV